MSRCTISCFLTLLFLQLPVGIYLKPSGPDVASCCSEKELTMLEEDESALIDHWSELLLLNPPQSSLTLQHGLQMGTMSSASKRCVDASSDSSDSANVDCLHPLAKVAKCTSVVPNVQSKTKLVSIFCPIIKYTS